MFVDAWCQYYLNQNSSEAFGFTFPMDNPLKRIDFILLRRSSVSEIFIFGNQATQKKILNSIDKVEDDIWPSDHYGIFASINLNV